MRSPRKWRYLKVMATLALGAAAVSCKQGPDYKRPPLDVPATYKSAATQATTQPAPMPRLGRDWWRLYNDKKLTELEDSAIEANQDVKAAMARVVQARAATRIVKSQFYPLITLDPSLQRQRTSGNGVGSTATGANHNGQTFTDTTIPFDLSYEVDIWGRVSRSVEAAEAQEQASVDDLEVVHQTMEADLAQDYFTLRSLDAQDKILERNVGLYRHQVELTEKQFKSGIVSKTDVLQAETLRDSTIAQEIDVRRQRADTEHAIAILLGRAPVELTLGTNPLDLSPPIVPPGLPADLLRRRPDVAEAEQNLVAANAQIGVAKANFYPLVQLTGAAGYESISIQKTLDWESRIWSLGPSVTIPVFEGGKLKAALKQSQARYDELLANYRTAVLNAFRDVEDSLTDLHMRADEGEAQDKAVYSAREYVDLANVQYKQGLATYLQVIDAERTLLTNELAAAQLLNERLDSSVLLMKAIGGGWEDPAHPSTQPSRPTTEPMPATTRPVTAATQPTTAASNHGR